VTVSLYSDGGALGSDTLMAQYQFNDINPANTTVYWVGLAISYSQRVPLMKALGVMCSNFAKAYSHFLIAAKRIPENGKFALRGAEAEALRPMNNETDLP